MVSKLQQTDHVLGCDGVCFVLLEYSLRKFSNMPELLTGKNALAADINMSDDAVGHTV
jgi:hypothetical protein